MHETPFIPDSYVQWAWDSTSLGLFKECPRKYYYRMILGLVPKDDRVHLTFGQFYHSALEWYDHKRVTEGLSHEDAMREATRKALIDSWGWNSDHPNKNRDTLIRSVVWYLDKFKDDNAKVYVLESGAPAVELSFKMELDFGVEGQPYYLCGYIDKVVTFVEANYVLDRKTSKYTLTDQYFDQYAPDNQFSLYSFVSESLWKAPIAGVLIDAAQIAVGFTAFRRGMTFRNTQILDEWHGDLRYWIGQAQACAEANYWPQNDKSCHKYMGCDYREICRLAPSARQAFLDTKFEKEPWNPLLLRNPNA